MTRNVILTKNKTKIILTNFQCPSEQRSEFFCLKNFILSRYFWKKKKRSMLHVCRSRNTNTWISLFPNSSAADTWIHSHNQSSSLSLAIIPSIRLFTAISSNYISRWWYISTIVVTLQSSHRLLTCASISGHRWIDFNTEKLVA